MAQARKDLNRVAREIGARRVGDFTPTALQNYIQERIDVLNSLKVDNDFEKDVKENLGKKMYNNLLIENAQETFQALTQLQLFHLITNYISHRVKQEQQARYQIAASKLFKL